MWLHFWCLSLARVHISALLYCLCIGIIARPTTLISIYYCHVTTNNDCNTAFTHFPISFLPHSIWDHCKIRATHLEKCKYTIMLCQFKGPHVIIVEVYITHKTSLKDGLKADWLDIITISCDCVLEEHISRHT